MAKANNKVTFSTYVIMLSVVGAIDLARTITWVGLTAAGLVITATALTATQLLNFIPFMGVAVGLAQQSVGIALWVTGMVIAIMFSVIQFIFTTLYYQHLGASFLDRGMLTRLGKALGLGFLPFSGIVTTYFTLKHIEKHGREYNEESV